MEDPTQVRISASDLRALTLSALRYMIYHVGWSKEKTGKAIGYGDGQMVGRVMKRKDHPKHTPLLKPEATWNLSRIASAHGFDRMSDEASPGGKLTVPAPESLPEGCGLDGDIGPERLLAYDHTSLLGAASCTVERARHASSLFGVAYALREEAHAAMMPGTGDGAAAEAALPLISPGN